MITEDITWDYLHIVDVDIRLVKTVEEDDSVRPVYCQRMGYSRNITDHFAHFDHDRDRNRFFHFADNIDIQIAHIITVVREVCFQEEHVQFQGVGSCQLDLAGKFDPCIRFIAVDACDNRDGT